MKQRLKKWTSWAVIILLALCVVAIAAQGFMPQPSGVPQKAERCTIFYTDKGGEPISLYCPTLGWLKAPFGPGQ